MSSLKDNYGFWVGRSVVWTCYAETLEDAHRIFEEFAVRAGYAPGSIPIEDVRPLDGAS